MVIPGVIFSGRRYQACRVTGPIASDDGGSIFQIRAGGRGRLWQAGDSLKCAWRDFVDTDLQDGHSICRFVSTHGDPHSRLSETFDTDTRCWSRLQAQLSAIARAMETGTGYDVDQELMSAVFAHVHYRPFLRSDLPIVFDRLDGLMVTEAMRMFELRTKLRRCRNCEGWMEVRRSNAVVCSHACRVSAAAKQET